MNKKIFNEHRHVAHIDAVDDLFNDDTHSVSANEDEINTTNVYNSINDRPGVEDEDDVTTAGNSNVSSFRKHMQIRTSSMRMALASNLCKSTFLHFVMRLGGQNLFQQLCFMKSEFIKISVLNDTCGVLSTCNVNLD